MAKKKLWSYTAGRRPNRVTVFEREPGGVLYAKCWDPSMSGGMGDMRKRSLGYRDKNRARAYALEQAAKFERGDAVLTDGRVTLETVFALYRQERTPRKKPSEQKADDRRIEMWTRALGKDRDPLKISLRDWEQFLDARSVGLIDARGCVAPEGKRRQVRARTIEADCRWMKGVFNWATKWMDGAGHYLLPENPIRGFEVPAEKNPRRAVMTQARYEKLLEVASEVTMEVPVHGAAQRTRSYLPELLVLANETGRRLSAILGLRYENLRLKKTPAAPDGAISWPSDTDKQGRSWDAVPISQDARAVLNQILRDHPGIGAAPLFPSPTDSLEPVDRWLADKWLRKAERLAGLRPQEGSLWHAFRRKAATELKGAGVMLARTGTETGTPHLTGVSAGFPQPFVVLEIDFGGRWGTRTLDLLHVRQAL